MGVKDILVVSHERSRTHYFINSIAINFGYIPEQIDVPPTRNLADLERFFEEYEPTGRNIVKSHHQYCTLKRFMKTIEEKFHIFYIIREGRDVMTSCHYYFNKATSDFPFTKTVGGLIKKNPQKFIFDSAYSEIKADSMAQRWAIHVLSWINPGNRENIHIISSDKLYLHFQDTIRFISFLLDNPGKQTLIRPLVGNSRSVAPRKGIIGDFITHLNEHEEETFFKEVLKVDKENRLYTTCFEKGKIYAEYRGE